MSEESGDISAAVDEGIEWLQQWYHVPSLLLLFVFAFWVRARNWGEYIIGGEVLYTGNDAWYHLRQVTYVTKHWPETMPFEAWTNYPRGTSVAQFGTIYDQAIATVALIVGLGNPSQETITLVHLFAPAVTGALIVIPTYYLGKRLGKSRLAGLLAVLVLVLSSGRLLRRSTVGFSDHHVAEALMQAVAVLAIVVAIQVADREKPVWELAVERNVSALRRPLGYATLGGIGLALYVWVWPPGVLLIGIMGLYVTLQSAVAYLRGESPEHVLLASAIVFAVAGVLLLLPLDSVEIQTLKFSLLQPGLAFAGVVWCGALAWLGRLWDEQSLPGWTYPVTTFTLVGTILAVLALAAPSKFGLLTDQLIRVFGRLFNVQPSAAASTVGEVQPLREPRQQFRWFYGLTHVIAGFGILLALVRQTIVDKPRSELLFVVIWAVTVLAAALTQGRFSYYLTVPIAVLTAYALGSAIRYVGELEASEADRLVEPYQLMAVFTALMLIIAPMVMIQIQGQQPSDVLSRSETNGPGAGIQGWSGSLDWMAENTPNEGTFQGASNELDYYGEFPKVDDFEYDEGTYGVLSWWDYGHWITTKGERIPVANPFQESATEAARFLLADDEQQAQAVLDTNMSDGDNRETRYVMVDWKMATTNANPQIGRGKFFAPPAFLDNVSRSDYYQRVIVPTQQGRTFFTLQKQAYYETMVTRLYRYHGSGAWPGYVSTGAFSQRHPADAGPTQIPVTRLATGQNGLTIPRDGNLTRFFQSTEAARNYVTNSQNDTSVALARVGGLGKYPSEHVPALQHYRLVHAGQASQGPYRAIQPGLRPFARAIRSVRFFVEPYSSWTKTFERVPGATVEGTVPGEANTSVYATVDVKIPTTNQTFKYVQEAHVGQDGTFEMTLPYSTSGYDNWGTKDGYTNASVRAVSDYRIESRPLISQDGIVRYNKNVTVPEAKVIGEDDEPIEVTLESTPIERPGENSSESDGGSGSDGSSGSITADPLRATSGFDSITPAHSRIVG